MTVSEAVLPGEKQILQTASAVEARGIHVEIVETGAQALEALRRLIPAGATVMTASSQSLKEIGFEALLASNEHPWVNLKPDILAEADTERRLALRRKSVLADTTVGSVQAIAESGELVVVSGSGSQIPAFAFSSPNVIWVAGIQKIVPTLEDALRRIREHSLPHAQALGRAAGKHDIRVGKLLIFEHESAQSGRSVHLILVKEHVGV